jgi:hypothetical protein
MALITNSFALLRPCVCYEDFVCYGNFVGTRRPARESLVLAAVSRLSINWTLLWGSTFHNGISRHGDENEDDRHDVKPSDQIIGSHNKA